MKKHLFFLMAGALILGASCSRLDQLEARLNELEQRLSRVENIVDDLNSNAAALKRSVEALEDNIYVTNVAYKNDGYTIYFSDNTQAVIKNGTDGQSATAPTIGVVEVDGVLVWAINGEPIKNGGSYVPVTATPETPEFKFENDTWYYRLGSGEWQVAGSGGGCNCSVEEGVDTVTITIGDTTVILPKAPEPPVNLSAEGAANCYIVPQSGRYTIAPVKGNTTESIGEVASVAVLWETVNTASAPGPGTIVTDAQVDDKGQILFTVPDPYKEGNALIAAKNAAGDIIWSWHIWVTDDEIGEVVMQNNAGIFMDRYLGAIGNEPGDTRARGFFYQWGRKDPFMGLASFGEAPFIRYAVSGTAETNKAAGADLDIAYTIAHPTVWALRDNTNNDWLYTGTAQTEDSRWAKDNRAKAMYDPCPPGWQVPGNGNWFNTAGLNGALTSGVTFDAEKGGVLIGAPYCTPDSWWPTTGQYANAGIRGVNHYFPHQYGGTWTGCTVGMSGGTNNASRVSMFRLTDNKFFPSENTFKQFGHAVRCRKI